MTNLFYGLLGGFIAWIVTTWIAQPFDQFRSLRRQAARMLVEYEKDFECNPERDAPSEKWATKRKDAYDQVGIELLVFHDSNYKYSRALRSIGGYYVKNAGWSFRTLAEAKPGTEACVQLRRSVVKYLKLREWPHNI